MIGDILFTLAAIGFSYSSIPQILKLRRVKNSIGISYKRHKILFVCIVITIIACIHTKLWLSTAMNSFQLICVIVLMYQIKKYRKNTVIYGGEKSFTSCKPLQPNKSDDYPYIKLTGDKK